MSDFVPEQNLPKAYVSAACRNNRISSRRWPLQIEVRKESRRLELKNSKLKEEKVEDLGVLKRRCPYKHQLLQTTVISGGENSDFEVSEDFTDCRYREGRRNPSPANA